MLVLPFVATLLVSSSLLFAVQPMMAKMLLPLLGGVPAVWTASVLFFQAALLAGYAYAHFAVGRLVTRRQVLVHAALMAAATLVLPIAIPAGWTPPVTENPVPWLLGALLVSAGPPFFVVAATGPLLQRWFAATPHQGARDPYFLFAASNAGSLLGLLAYPFLLERELALDAQSDLWTGGYALLFTMVMLCAAVVWRRGAPRAAEEARAEPVRPAERVRWIALAFVPSSLMLGVTAQVTSEVAPIPLLWVAGLALYLLTFVYAFGVRSPAPGFAMVNALPPLVLTVVIVTFFAVTHATWVLFLNLATFTLAALVCHGQLASRRPAPAHLTDFYLCVAVGGALGGLLNGLVAPVVFNGLVEYPFALILACLLRPSLLAEGRRSARPLGIAALAAGALVVAQLVSMSGRENVLAAERSFFGVYKVKELIRDDGRYHGLVDGNTLHGLQSLDPARRREPLLYFYRGGPAGQVFDALRGRHPTAHVGVVGLGAGSLACYARPGDTWTFFEVDPVVERIARDRRLFTLLSGCAPSARVVLGDGRLRVAREPDASFDLLVLDAFKSETLPVHLVTREAIEMYKRKLRPGGMLLFDVSNHYLDLRPVLARVALAAGLHTVQRVDEGVGRDRGRASSRWVAMGEVDELAAHGWGRLQADPGDRAWTDQYSDLVGALR